MDDEGHAEVVRRCRELVEAQQYLTMATADSDGTPWATTVWYAVGSLPGDPDPHLLWLSLVDARHSANLAARPRLGLSIFDSTQPGGTGLGLQMAGVGEQVPPSDVDAAVRAFSEASVAAGGDAWTREQVEGDSPARLYRVRIDEAYVLAGRERTPVPLR